MPPPTDDDAARRRWPRPRRAGRRLEPTAAGGTRAGREAAGAGQAWRPAATIPEIGATVLTLSNGVEVWLKPTDFKNDQVLFTAYAPGGVSLAPRSRLHERRAGHALVGVGGMGGLNPVDLEQDAGGQDRAGVARTSATTRTAVAGRARRRISRRRCSSTISTFTAPEHDRRRLRAAKRRFSATLQNRAQSPRCRVRREGAQVNTSNHYSA